MLQFHPRGGVTMLGIPATALEAAMEKARAKASREQPDLGSEYS